MQTEDATFIISGGTCMIFMDRAAFIAALETYVLTMNILPERAESLHDTSQDTRRRIV